MKKVMLVGLFAGVGLCLSGKFLYISDIHFDPIADCERYNQTTYCRDPALGLGVPEEVQQYYRRLAGYAASDANVAISAPLSAGSSFGRYGCDSPYELLDSAYADAAKELPAPDFILYGGDVAAHSLNATMVRRAWETMHNVIVRHFGPKVPVYVTIGNNDLGTHYLADCSSKDLSVLTELLISWGWLGADQRQTFMQAGAYSTLVPGTRLRIISLNTNVYTRRPVHIEPKHEPADCGQLAWLDAELTRAGNSGESVLLLGHIPAGTDSFNGMPMWNETFLATFQKIMERHMQAHPAMIVHTTFAHVHKSEFRLMGNAAVNPYGSFGIVGAVSPVYSNNPTYRIVSYSADAAAASASGYYHDITDFEDHFLDLRASSRTGKATWLKDYTFTKAYGVDGVNTKAMAKVVDDVRKSSIKLSELLDRSSSHYNENEKNIICIMTTNNKSEYDACVKTWLD